MRVPLGALFGVLALLLAAVAWAQMPSATGGESMRALIDEARREGELVVYTSMPVDDMRVLTTAFEAAYGVRVVVWRASSEKVVARVIAEARAGRFDVDLIETGGPDLEALVRERLLQPVSSPAHAELIPEALPAHGKWAGTRLSIFVQAYNTRLVDRAELPRSWEDLAHPRWKGRLAIEAEDADWFAAVLGVLGEDRGAKLFRRIVATNGLSVRKGHSLLAQLVAAGEVPLALTVYNYKAQQLKEKGAPIEWFAIPPAIARANGVGVGAHARHPNAARLFYEFVLGRQGQEILLSRDYVPTNRSLATPLNRLPLKFVDAAAALDQSPRWDALYREIVLNGPR